ncbi:kinase-like domain, phloem protein 2-like protein [Tanacetum coccineum]
MHHAAKRERNGGSKKKLKSRPPRPNLGVCSPDYGRRNEGNEVEDPRHTHPYVRQVCSLAWELKGKSSEGKMRENSYEAMSLALVNANGKKNKNNEGAKGPPQVTSSWKVKTASEEGTGRDGQGKPGGTGIKKLNENIPKTVDEMMIVTKDFIRGEKSAANQSKRRSQPWKQPDFQKSHPKQGFERKEDVKRRPMDRKGDRFTPLTKTPKEILAMEVGKGTFTTPPLMSRALEFGEVAVITFRGFFIKKEIKSDVVSPETTYASYLIYKLPQDQSKYKGVLKITNYKGRICEERNIYLVRPLETPIIGQKLDQNTHNPLIRPKLNAVPRQRKDGWMEVKVWQFQTSRSTDSIYMGVWVPTPVGVNLSGLIVESIEDEEELSDDDSLEEGMKNLESEKDCSNSFEVPDTVFENEGGSKKDSSVDPFGLYPLLNKKTKDQKHKESGYKF